MEKINELKAYVKTDFCTNIVYNRHCHLGCEFIYVTNGSIKISIESTEYILKSGDAIMIKPQKYHLVVGNNALYGRLVAEFPREFVPSVISERFFSAIERNPVLSRESNFLTNKLTECIEANHPMYDPLVHSLLIHIIYYYCFDNPAENATESVTDKIINGAVDYIDRYLDSDFTLADIAGALFISVSSLSHLFKEKMKISVKQYILQKKMYYAAQLLREGMPASEVAFKCGYDNYSSFYKVFLRIIGTPPSKSL